MPLFVTPTKAVWYHRHGDKVTFETRIDDAPAIRAAEIARQVEELKKPTPQERNMGLKRIASVPMTVYRRSITEKWTTEDWWKWVNNPDNKYLRVWPGRM